MPEGGHLTAGSVRIGHSLCLQPKSGGKASLEYRLQRRYTNFETMLTLGIPYMRPPAPGFPPRSPSASSATEKASWSIRCRRPAKAP